ncbi:MAG: hypothetical protein U5R31_12435 [Acidimicrobiia bacterium]|nr:hypothetical protein [Acidimicrobiia bacterium]
MPRTSWLLRDPETLPAIVGGPPGRPPRRGDPRGPPAGGAGDVDALEAVFYDPGSPILDMTPELVFTDLDEAHRRPRYTWTISGPDDR